MPAKVKVTVSLDAALVRDLAEARRQSGKSRSRLMEEALHLWRRSQLEEALKRGYRAMAEEDRDTAERNVGATWEVVK